MARTRPQTPPVAPPPPASERPVAAHVARAIAAAAQARLALALARSGGLAAHVQRAIEAPAPGPVQAARAQPAVRRPAAGGAAAAVQRMNVESTFKTKYGSTYTVSVDSLTREKYYGGSSTNPKTVLYGDEKTTGDCLKARDRCDSYRVKDAGFGTVTIQFFADDKCFYSAKLQRWPEVGLYPVDMILDAYGRGAMPDDRFHIGDRIGQIG